MSEEEETPPPQFRHNWLYSVLPARPQYNEWASDQLWLTGYCRACDQAFSKVIPFGMGGHILITKMDIPKWGCVEPNV